MSDRKQALEDLLAKVEVGSGIEYSAYQKAFPHPPEFEHEFGKTRDKARGAFIGSLDAAKALHDAVLPKWHWSLFADTATVFQMVHPYDGNNWSSQGGCQARAWLSAILKALIAEADT